MSFIVIEGLDGSGKSTQIRLFRDFLENCGISCKYVHFPRTGSPIYGDLIARFLRGDFGNKESVHPCLVALLYAGDRHNAAESIRRWLNAGHWVLLDRYVISNIAFQCAKLDDPDERQNLKDWIYRLEYGYNKIPVPDLNIFLDVPFYFTREKLSGRRAGDDRRYLNGGEDIHEADLEFQKRVREVYLEVSREDESMYVVDCGNSDNTILPPEKIFERIRKVITL